MVESMSRVFSGNFFTNIGFYQTPSLVKPRIFPGLGVFRWPANKYQFRFPVYSVGGDDKNLVDRDHDKNEYICRFHFPDIKDILWTSYTFARRRFQPVRRLNIDTHFPVSENIKRVSEWHQLVLYAHFSQARRYFLLPFYPCSNRITRQNRMAIFSAVNA